VAVWVLAAVQLCGCLGTVWAQGGGAVPQEPAGLRDPDGKRVVPFYGLYCWASDFESPQYLDLVKQTGFGLISTAVGPQQERGMLAAARSGIEMAGYFSPNRWAKPGDVEGYRTAVREAATRYGPGGSLWRENPDVPARPIRYWGIDGEPRTKLKPEGDTMPDEAYTECLKVAHEELKAWNKECRVVAMGPIGCVDGALPGPTYVDKQRKVMSGQAFIRGVHEHGGFPYYLYRSAPVFVSAASGFDGIGEGPQLGQGRVPQARPGAAHLVYGNRLADGLWSGEPVPHDQVPDCRLHDPGLGAGGAARRTVPDVDVCERPVFAVAGAGVLSAEIVWVLQRRQTAARGEDYEADDRADSRPEAAGDH